MAKLIVTIMGQNCEKFIGMCLDSVKDADAIIYCDGGSKASFWEYMSKTIKPGVKYSKFHNIQNKWNPEDPQMNGKQRNFYLKYLKENYPDDWALCLDADELVEDLQKIKDFINKRDPGMYNVKMRHFIGNIGHEDATKPVHIVPGRLFKISEAKGYPLHSHPVLEGELRDACLDTTIWHMGHLPVEYMDYILKRYNQHAEDSVIHNQNFLKQWKLSHLFGQYPAKLINPVELPKQILDRYEIDKDEFYFANRGLEVKHFIDAIHWKEFFKCESVIEFGCGKGPRVFAMQSIGIDAKGYEISNFAISNKLCKKIWEANITEDAPICGLPEQDLSIGYDILEHIEYSKLDKAIYNIIKTTKKYILISVPVLGDPNLEADPTHIIKEDKEWWIKKFTDKELKLIPTPEHFLYKEQIMIFEK